MRNSIKIVLFMLYTIVLFFVKDIKCLLGMMVLNGIITIVLKINLGKMFHSIKIFLPFVAITMLFNICLASVLEAILMGIRIIICYQATYLFSQTITTLEVADVVQKICIPLKLLKINTRNIGIMISISISMLPIFRKEIEMLIQAMKSKGKQLKLNNMIIIMKPMLISVFRKTNQMEKTLIAKAYEE